MAERIEHVERFLVAMRAQRTAVVNLLMWEIGKTQADSEKEFDRTADLIVETIRALWSTTPWRRGPASSIPSVGARASRSTPPPWCTR